MNSSGTLLHYRQAVVWTAERTKVSVPFCPACQSLSLSLSSLSPTVAVNKTMSGPELLSPSTLHTSKCESNVRSDFSFCHFIVLTKSFLVYHLLLLLRIRDRDAATARADFVHHCCCCSCHFSLEFHVPIWRASVL